MKNFYVFLCLLAMSFVAFAQKENVGIGTMSPDQSAILDLSSGSKGFLVPRLSLQQRGTIQNPATGLMVFQTDFISGFYYYNGKDWKAMTNTEANSVASTQGTTWDVTGNAGTTPGTNFIGTTDNNKLVFKVYGAKAGLIDHQNYVTTFGFLAGNSNTASYNTFIGYTSGYSNTSGGGNIGIGASALYANTTGVNNTAIGSNALYNNTIGTYNTAIGIGALQTTTSGGGNVGIGPNSLGANTTGQWNVGIGTATLQANTNGQYNLAIGGGALFSNLSGSYNLAIGNDAGRLATGSNNIFLGPAAGYNETTSDKLYIANTNTATPLIYGDFGTAKYLAIGEVAVADRAAAATGGYRLLVKGGMMTEKIKVAVAGTADWADYVFEPSYKLLSLEKVESFVKENKHLPNVPSAEEMSKNGLDVTTTSAKLMEKIEELTLYVIELNKEIKKLKEERK